MIILFAQEKKFQRKFCKESSNLPFAVPGNVKLKLPNKAQTSPQKYCLHQSLFIAEKNVFKREETGRRSRK